MKFDVFLPSLLVSPDWFADSSPPRLPAIETLLMFGQSRQSAEWPLPLLAAFGTTNAVAALSALGDELDVGNNGWMFADPAHFQADRDTVNLISASYLAITADETAQLLNALNMNFEDRGLVFSCGASGAWYVRCPPTELPQTTSFRAAQRGTVFEKLPQSTGKLSWKAIQNEAQMLFHSHAVNEQREAAGKLTINGLWFWGEGIAPATETGRKSSIGAVFGDTALVKGLARIVAARCAPSDQLDIACATSLADHNLLALDALTAFHERGDAEGWRVAALKLDTQFFAPLLAALRTGAITDIKLTLPRDRDSLAVAISAESLRGISGWWRKFTKRPRPFLESAHA